MVNICIDGNFWFHKTFGIYAGYGDVNPGEILKTKEEQSAFINKVATDLIASLRLLPAGGRLVFTSDSKSWRKDIEIEDGGYKSGRVKNEEVDWSIFYELMHALGTHLEKMGFIYSRIEGAEGDDLLLYWSEKFNDMGQSCIIISGDKDLHQLVKMKSKDVWTVTWNSNSKNNILATPIGWEKELIDAKKDTSEISIFNMGSVISTEKDKLIEFIQKVTIEEIDTFPFIFNKILIGDKGDSVPSVWEYLKNEKVYRFTPKSAEKVYDIFLESEFKNLSISELYSNDNFLNWISPIILRIAKEVDSSENRIKVKSNFIRNVKLMWLNDGIIPENVSMKCRLETDRGLKLEKRVITLNRIEILKGTDWTTNAIIVPKFVDPFANFLD